MQFQINEFFYVVFRVIVHFLFDKEDLAKAYFDAIETLSTARVVNMHI